MSVTHKHVKPDWPNKVPTRIAFIAEAPSDEEVIAGRPLVGPSGRVFNQLLRTAGLERAEFLVTNVFDEQAPGNEVDKYFFAGTKEVKAGAQVADLPTCGVPTFGVRYLRREYLWHLDRLRDEILSARPTVIVPMGSVALWALTGETNITATRGSVLASRFIVPGVKLVPTLHPAHVIHDWRLFHTVVADLEKAWRESEFPEVRLPKRELWLCPTLGDLRYFKAKFIDQSDLLSCDIETGWGQITCIGFAPDRHRAIVVPFVDLRKPNRSYWPTADDELAAWEWVSDVLGSPTPKLFQNGPYDITWLWDRYGIRVRNYREDTRLIHHALHPELPKSLEFMGGTYATQGPWKLLRPGRQQEKRDA